MAYFFGIMLIMFGVVILGSYAIIKFLPIVPQIFKDFFFYGKVKNKTFTKAKLIEIPKRYFIHFYFLGAVANGFMALHIMYCYYYKVSLLYPFNNLIQWTNSKKIPSQLNPLTPNLLLCMMWFQNIRRYLECRYVHIYSEATMNLLHFSLAIYFYTTFPILVLSDTVLPQKFNGNLSNNIELKHVVGLAIFLISSFIHHNIHKALASLRMDSKGKVKTLKHSIPSGHWLFEYVSCPHYLCEVVIYFSLLIVDGFQSFNIIALFFFVISNQTVAAKMVHQWYQKTFEDYPSQRKAIFPFLI